MYLFGAPNWLHSLLLFVMILLILTGRRGGGRETRLRGRHERAALRAALVAELTALRGVYRLNETLAAAGAPQSISCKEYFSQYRGNMHRLLLLTSREVAAIVAAYAASQTLEGALALGVRPRGRHADLAAWDPRLLDMAALRRDARSAVAEALALLDSEAARAAAEDAVSWRRRVARWREWWEGRRPPADSAARVNVPALPKSG